MTTDAEVARLRGELATAHRRISELSGMVIGTPSRADERGDLRARVAHLETSLRFLRGIFDSVDTRICVIDQRGTIVEVNRAWRVFNDEKMIVPRPHVGDYYVNYARSHAGATRDIFLAIAAGIDDVLHGRRTNHATEYPLEIDGRQRWYQARVTPLAEARAVVVQHIDVTDRVAAMRREATQGDELDRLALVARYTDNAVVITDARLRIEWVNEGFTRRTGWRLDEVAGRQPGDFLHGPETDPEAIEYMRGRVAKHLGFDVEVLNYRRDGSTYWASVEMRAIGEAGEDSRGYIFIESDITSQREHAQRIREKSMRVHGLAMELRREKLLLESVVSTIPHALCWTDSTFRVIGCNDKFLALLGADAGEPRGAAMGGILAMYFRRDPRAYEKRVLRDGHSIIDEEHAWRRPDGSEGTMLSSAVALRGDDRAISGMLWVGTDISALRGLEAQLGQARRLEAIGQLAAGVAHEINTPSQYVSDNIAFIADAFASLRPVLSAVRAAIDTNGDAKSVALLSDAASAADMAYLLDETPAAISQAKDGLSHIKKIVLAMKEFSHPGQQGKEAVDLNKLVRNVIMVARNEWKYVAEVELDLDDQLPRVSAVASGINQVVLNLIVNAAHALGERGERGLGHIVLRTRAEPDFVVLEVSDDGCGIPPAIMQRIFDPFFTTKEVGRGTGQGLAIAHSVVYDVHGGNIAVASTEGVGTCFTVRLPLKASTAGE